MLWVDVVLLIDAWTEGREKRQPGDSPRGPAVKPSVADLKAIFGIKG